MRDENRRLDIIRLVTCTSIVLATLIVSLLLAQDSTSEATDKRKYGITVANLPYNENSLEPWISEKVVRFHYYNIHRNYYNLLKAYIKANPEYQYQTVTELIRNNQNKVRLDGDIFELSILLYNHNWYWSSLSPAGGGIPKGKIGEMINAAFGSYDGFRTKFIEIAMRDGDGWIWVMKGQSTIIIYRTEKSESVALSGYEPLLAVDLWGHAYYSDYQNDRRKHVEAVLDHLINWQQADNILNNDAVKLLSTR